MKPYSINVSWIANSNTFFAAAQALTAGVPLIFTNPVTTANFASGTSNIYAVMPLNNVRLINLTSGANVSEINFTITGLSGNGALITETLAGPNADTVNTDNYYSQVFSIVPSATSASTVSAGIGNGFTTPYVHDVFNKHSLISFQIKNVTGTLSALPQATLDLPFESLAGSQVYNPQTWFSIPSQSVIAGVPEPAAFPLTAAGAFAFSDFPVASSSFVIGPNVTTFTLTVLQQGAKV